MVLCTFESSYAYNATKVTVLCTFSEVHFNQETTKNIKAQISK